MSRPFLASSKALRKMPPNFEAFVWRAAPGCLALNLHIGSVLSSSPLAKYWWVGIKVYPIREPPNEFIPSDFLAKYPATSLLLHPGFTRRIHRFSLTKPVLWWVFREESEVKPSHFFNCCACLLFSLGTGESLQKGQDGSTQIEDVPKMSGVFGAKCMEFTLKPRLVLTNASDQELWLETQQKRQGKLDKLFVCVADAGRRVDKPILLAKIWNFEPCPNVTFPGKTWNPSPGSWNGTLASRVWCIGKSQYLGPFNDGNVTRLPRLDSFFM